MNLIQQECVSRGITRICHFTQSRNLAHIFDDTLGIYSTRTLKQHDMPHNPTDPNRYDGMDDLICCSIEYPNTYYFATVRGNDPLFKDWVVLFIKPNYLWQPNTLFCPCNAARNRGAHIQGGIDGFRSLYASNSPGFPSYTRLSNHLLSAPTDIQAEALLKEPILLKSITGIAVKSEEQAQCEKCRFTLQEISLDKPIYVVPEFFERNTLPRYIQRGNQVIEKLVK